MFAVAAPVTTAAPALRARAVARRASSRVATTVRAQQKADDLSRREAVIGAAASMALLAAPAPARALDVGATAPGFTLPSTGGGSVTLAGRRPLASFTLSRMKRRHFTGGTRMMGAGFTFQTFGGRERASEA